MKKIILKLIIINTIAFGSIFGETKEEQQIAQKKIQKLMFQGQNKEVIKLKKENNKLKKILKKRKINYEHALKANGIKKIGNSWITTEEKEIKILKAENTELKRLVKKHTNNNKTNNKTNDEKKEREKAKEELKKQMSL